MRMAEKITRKLQEFSVEFTVLSPTNQIFVALPKEVVETLSKKYKFEDMGTRGEQTVVRICTSWATKEENTEALLADLERIFA